MTAGYIILGLPDWTRPRLAPEGDRLAAIRWHDGAANIWIGSSKAPMQLVTDCGHGGCATSSGAPTAAGWC